MSSPTNGYTQSSQSRGSSMSRPSSSAHALHSLKMPVLTWTPKVCKIIALMAVILGLGPLFYILFGFRYCLVGNKGLGFRVQGLG